MAKKPKKTRVPRELTRRQVSRLEKERRMQKGLVWGVIAIAVIVVGVLAYGLIVENVIKAREPVAIVGGVPISTSEFQARVRFMRMQMRFQLSSLEQQRQSVDPTSESADLLLNYFDGQISQLQNSLALENAQAIGDQAVDSLILYELARQEADRRGIVITEDDVQRAIELGFDYDRDAASLPLTSTESLSPTEATELVATPMTEEGFRENYDYMVNEALKPLGISEKLYRSWIRGDLAAQKVRDAMLAEVPLEGDQVKLTVLAVSSAEGEALANELAARLDAGESMEAIATELEAAEEPKAFVNELDWLPQSAVEDRLGVQLADLIFGLSVGERTLPVLSETGEYFYIVEVVGHEIHEYSEDIRKELADERFEAWYQAQLALAERRSYSDRVPTDP